MTFKDLQLLTDSASEDDTSNDLLAMADTIERPMYFVRVIYDSNDGTVGARIEPVFITDHNRVTHIIQHIKYKGNGFCKNNVTGNWHVNKYGYIEFKIFSFRMSDILKFIYITTMKALGEKSAKDIFEHVKSTPALPPVYDYEYFTYSYTYETGDYNH